MNTRWQGTNAPRGDDYDARWTSLAAQGQSIHGEADLVEALLREFGGTRVLDAGCGTGRVGIELAARGFATVGVDADNGMLSAARAKASELEWIEADLSDLRTPSQCRVRPGAPGGKRDDISQTGKRRPRHASALSACLRPGALLVAGFAIRPDRLPLEMYDRLAKASGLEFVGRWATWNREPFTGGDYAVTVHRRRP